MTDTYLAAELATQPDDWRWAASIAPDVAGDLPQPGERAAVVGCGTSFFMALAYAALREAGGHGLTEAWPASEHRLDRGYDRVVLLTRSGTTSEVMEVAERYHKTTALTVVTAVPDSPLHDLASPIVLDRVDERSVVQSRFATTALALLRASLGEALTEAADAAQVVVEARESELGPAVEAEQATFIGRGWTVGLAHEAALKLRETSQAWAESYPAMEYRHGPISIAAPNRLTWAFGDVPDGLADQVRSTGAAFDHADVDPMAELVRVHRVCVARAAAAGLDVDRPRSLTRSVVIDG